MKEEQAIEIMRKKISFKEKLELRDDAGLYPMGSKFLVVSTDILSRKTHFPDFMKAEDIGYKSVAVNVSDVAAMGAQPFGVSVAYSVPENRSFLSALAEGVNSACSKFGIRLLSSDTKAFGDTVVCGTAFGLVDKKGLLKRTGAKPGELVCVSGDLGRAYCALQVMLKGKRSAHRKIFLEKFCRPEIRLGLSRQLSKKHLASSCTDISDGLLWSLKELADLSGRGFDIDSSALPLRKETREFASVNRISLTDLLSGGEDFELLFTAPAKSLKKLKGVSVIGKVSRKKGIRIDSMSVKPKRFSTFSS